MKKLILAALVCAAAVAAPAMAQTISSARAHVNTEYTASVEGFNLMKGALTRAINNIKAANTSASVSNAVYVYIKNYLPLSKYYEGLTAAQKKQIDTLQKQVGLQIRAKESKLGCKKDVDAAINKGTLEAISSMK